MSWLDDVISGLLQGLDRRGRLCLDKNNGNPLPISNLPVSEIDHNILKNYNPNEHIDWQNTDKSFKTTGSAEFNDCIQNGYKRNQTLLFNTFHIIDTEWKLDEIHTHGLIYCYAGNSYKYFNIPLSGLKIGDVINQFQLLGFCMVPPGGDQVQISYNLNKVTIAGGSQLTSLYSGVWTSQENWTANPVLEDFDPDGEVGVEVVGAQYLMVIGARCGTSTDVYISGLRLVIDRK